MVGLNLYVIVIGIVALTTTLDVNGSVISLQLSVFTVNDPVAVKDPVAEFFISSDKRTWKNSVQNCESTGKKLANLDRKDERDALKFALMYKNYADDTKFWVYTCKLDISHYCEGHCTEVTYKKNQNLRIKMLEKSECETRKNYICKVK